MPSSTSSHPPYPHPLPPLAQAERAKAAAQPYVEGAQEVASDTAAAAKGTGEVSMGLLVWPVREGAPTGHAHCFWC